MTKSKKLGDLSIKKPSSQAEESVKGGRMKASNLRAFAKANAKATARSVGLARKASARRANPD